MPNFYPTSARVGCGALKLKMLPKFWRINTPQGRLPWAIYTKFSSFVGSFMFGRSVMYYNLDRL